MNYRKATLLAETDLSSAGTKTIDINVADIISRLTIAWRTVTSKHGMDSYHHRDITKIELVDGSDIFHGLDGGENQAVCIYDRKCPAMNHGQHMKGESEYSIFAIDFGRFLYDPLYAFDPKKFTNPQLKITHNYRVSDTAATEGNMEIWADLFDEKAITPVGFLTAREIKDYTVASSGIYDYVDLPTDLVIRKLFVQGYLSANEPWATVIEARLSEDGDKRIPFDLDLEDYYRVMKGVWTPIEEQAAGSVTGGGSTYFGMPTDYWATAVVVSRTVNNEIYVNPWGKGGSFKITPSAPSTGFTGVFKGFLPNHVYELPLGDPMDPNDWYDVTELGSLELRVKTGGTTGGHIKTFLQQLRLYTA